MVQLVFSSEDRQRYLGIYRYESALQRAAKSAHCNPQVSGFHVRAATILEIEVDLGIDGEDSDLIPVLGGNTEYRDPRAIHGETSLVNHVINLYGPEKARELLRFVALYSSFGAVTPCGDCRDYLLASTDPTKLVIVSAGEKDPNVQIHRFTDFLLPEEKFDDLPNELADELGLSESRLKQLAEDSQKGGVYLFTKPEERTRATVLARRNREGHRELYSASGCDDAAFHFRHPIGGALQAAADNGFYFVDVIIVAKQGEGLPKVSYRDRQYANDADGFNKTGGRKPLALVVTNGQQTKAITLDRALPYSFSTADFAPEKVEAFLKSKGAL